MRRLIFLLLCLSLLWLGGCQAEPLQQETNYDYAKESEQAMLIEEDEVYSDIQIERLFFTDTQNQALAAINTALEDIMADYIATTQEQDQAQRLIDPLLSVAHDQDYTMHYLDEFCGSVVASIVVEGYDNTAGAAHPFTYRRGYNFELTTGRRLELADYFGVEYRQCIVDLIIAQVESAGTEDELNPTYQEDLYRYLAEDQWYIDAGKIVIVYDPYQVAPYPQGIVEFRLDVPQS